MILSTGQKCPQEAGRSMRWKMATLLVTVVVLTALPLIVLGSDTGGRINPDSNRIIPNLNADPMKESVTLPGRRTRNGGETAPRIIRPGDRIQIEVGGEDWGGTYQVPRNGKIDFRFLGPVDVANKTKAELTQILKQQLRDYYVQPDVIINFVKISERKGPPPIYFGGHVNNKGAISTGGPISFARAISMVGGFTTKANPEKTRVLRRDGRLRIINGFKHQDPSDWKSLEPLTLYPGDYVYVPGGKFREEVSQVYTAGAVKRPRSGTVKNPIPLGVAIAKTSDGLTNNADLSNVQITRANGETLTINGQKQLELANVPPEERVYIKPGDYIYIPSKTTERIEVTVLGAVGEPQEVKLSKGDGVMDALVKAGSINQNSNRWKMYIFRKKGKETVIKYASYSRFVRGDLSQNIPLKNGDVVYVRTRFWPYFDTLNDVLRTIGFTTQSAVDIQQLERLGN